MTEPTIGPRCGNNPNARVTLGDQKVVDDFRATLALREAAKPHIDRAAWVDGDPLMETIAHTIWNHCTRDDTDMPHAVCDDPRTIAAFAAAVVRAYTEGPTAEAQQPDTATGPGPSAEDLAGHLAAQRMSVLQGAFRILGWPPLRFEVAPDPEQPAAEATSCAHRGPHPGFTCAEVDQARPYWNVRWGQEQAEAQQGSGQPGCSARPCNPAADELCDNHARIKYHGDGEHAFCEPGCGEEPTP